MKHCALSPVLICLLVIAMCSACTNSSDNDNTVSADPFLTRCGVVVNGKLVNPPDTGVGELITSIQPLRSDRFIVGLSTGPIPVQLHGVESTGLSQATQTALVGTLYYFPAGCTIREGNGGEVRVGQIISSINGSVTESLITAGVPFATTNRAGCQEQEVTACYRGLQEQNPPFDGGSSFGGGVPTAGIAGRIEDFLWKPVSERDGNLVVLAEPRNARIVVNGETLASSGPSNGRGSTARGTRPGCAYGNDVLVQVLDASNRAYTFEENAPAIRIPRGCDRVEFQN